MNAKSLKDLYGDELKDLWSANDQMVEVVQTMAKKASDEDLRASLKQSVAGITRHAESIESLLKDADEKAKTEQRKGMEGLVKEATKHITKEAPESEELLDIIIIAQYQRMSHYGLAGFGTAAAYAKALGWEKHSRTLTKIVEDIRKGDQYATALAAHAEDAASAADDDEE